MALVGHWSHAFHHHERWKELADLTGQFRMPLGVLRDRGPFSMAVPFQELFRQFLNRISIV
jgi:hypothetical protein